ncbi:hypothetical protein CEXT_639371 [Caerostris extrusa]|uniref:Transmembrane protein n=1 Tax=Caerostris extrusa TaxID=172846 RepID=A0AAV4X1V9_CAEEX|nr:hypothetical protein CEXT_639371 [Caerostris extrusa]
MPGRQVTNIFAISQRRKNPSTISIAILYVADCGSLLKTTAAATMVEKKKNDQNGIPVLLLLVLLLFCLFNESPLLCWGKNRESYQRPDEFDRDYLTSASFFLGRQNRSERDSFFVFPFLFYFPVFFFPLSVGLPVYRLINFLGMYLLEMPEKGLQREGGGGSNVSNSRLQKTGRAKKGAYVGGLFGGSDGNGKNRKGDLGESSSEKMLIVSLYKSSFLKLFLFSNENNLN